jgi:multisubunit Na+/H+ antiporter MnhG subunit
MKRLFREFHADEVALILLIFAFVFLLSSVGAYIIAKTIHLVLCGH